uniref:DUF4371 domain-containing protein n=1 Tax=Romanomermis culicivorax TaxID=13658 RepID=A0A915IVZ4_ROMCU
MSKVDLVLSDIDRTVEPLMGKETKRFLRHEHLETYKNLAYSPSQRGVYCKECVLFAKVESGGRSKQDLKTLVATPLKEFGHMFGKNGYITEHLDCAYHKNAVADAANFIERYENPQFDIRNQLDAKPLLKFRADAGDKAIDLSDTKKNAMYFSPLIQNSLIDCCGDLIVSNILEDVKKAKFYTILADETTDSATVEQMSLCIRYTDDKIREIFIGFIEVENMTGRGLATTIISKLKEIGLSIDNLVGQEQLCGEKRKKHLKPLCETRWVERHEAVTTFCLLFEDVLDCLSTISTFNDHSASTKASILLKSLQDSEFLVSLATLEKVLSLTIGLSRQLQSRELDLMVSKSMVKTVIDELESWINGPAFDAAFKRAESLAHMAGEALRLPRITAKQRQQHGETDLDLKIFFKKTIFNVFLQNVVDSLKYRFNEEQ